VRCGVLDTEMTQGTLYRFIYITVVCHQQLCWTSRQSSVGNTCQPQDNVLHNWTWQSVYVYRHVFYCNFVCLCLCLSGYIVSVVFVTVCHTCSLCQNGWTYHQSFSLPASPTIL